MPKAVEVFTPTSFPTYTYVDRGTLNLEQQFKQALTIPNMIVSVSGPSKSGKTVLINKVVASDNMIALNGAQIKSTENLWDIVLDWMGAPSESQHGSKKSFDGKLAVKAGGEVGVPLVLKGKAETELSGGATVGTETKTTHCRGGLTQVIGEIANSDFVVFIDDFHYIPRDLQPEIGRQLKAAAERGVKICIASVPHRSDDAVRSNSELTGRIASVDLTYWTSDELTKIAYNGFRELNVDLSPDLVTALTAQAFGSPQLMQVICLNLCFWFNIADEARKYARLEIKDEELQQVFERTSAMAGDFSSLLEALHAGPKQRGSERKTFKLTDGSEGDVYRCILLALKSEPPSLSITYDEMLIRVGAASTDGTPVGSSVSGSLVHMSQIAEKFVPRALEWDEDMLDIIEPYFLFFLRYSPKLRILARK